MRSAPSSVGPASTRPKTTPGRRGPGPAKNADGGSLPQHQQRHQRGGRPGTVSGGRVRPSTVGTARPAVEHDPPSNPNAVTATGAPAVSAWRDGARAEAEARRTLTDLVKCLEGKQIFFYGGFGKRTTGGKSLWHAAVGIRVAYRSLPYVEKDEIEAYTGCNYYSSDVQVLTVRGEQANPDDGAGGGGDDEAPAPPGVGGGADDGSGGGTLNWKMFPVRGQAARAMPQGRTGHVFAHIGGFDFLIFGGRNTQVRKSPLIGGAHIFSRDSREWRRVKSSGCPAPRTGASACVFEERVYIFGGQLSGDALYTNDVVVFDIATETWIRPAVEGTPPDPVALHSAEVIDGVMYVFGGERPTADKVATFCSPDVFTLDLRNASSGGPIVWRYPHIKGHTPSGRVRHACTAIGSRMYVFGGESNSHGRQLHADMYCLDTTEFVWSAVRAGGVLPSMRDDAAMFAASDNLLVVVGGWTGDYAIDDLFVQPWSAGIHVLDLDVNKWRTVPESVLGTPRYGARIAVVDDGTGPVFARAGIPVTIPLDVDDATRETMPYLIQAHNSKQRAADEERRKAIEARDLEEKRRREEHKEEAVRLEAERRRRRESVVYSGTANESGTDALLFVGGGGPGDADGGDVDGGGGGGGGGSESGGAGNGDRGDRAVGGAGVGGAGGGVRSADDDDRGGRDGNDRGGVHDDGPGAGGEPTRQSPVPREPLATTVEPVAAAGGGGGGGMSNRGSRASSPVPAVVVTVDDDEAIDPADLRNSREASPAGSEDGQPEQRGKLASLLAPPKSRARNRAPSPWRKEVFVDVRNAADGEMVYSSSRIFEAHSGVFKLRTVIHGAGMYNVDVLYGGQSLLVAGPLKVLVEAGEVEPQRSLLEGDGLDTAVAGELATYTVTTMDNFGNRLTRGDLRVTSYLLGPEPVFCDVNDDENGTYTVSYSPSKKGSYLMTIEVDNVKITGHGIPMSVLPGPTRPSECRIGLTGPQFCTAGKSGSFVITAYDSYGNRREVGGDAVSCIRSGPMPLECRILDSMDGTYTFSYRAVRVGNYEVRFKVDGLFLRRERAYIIVEPGEPFAGTSYIVHASGQQQQTMMSSSSSSMSDDGGSSQESGSSLSPGPRQNASSPGGAHGQHRRQRERQRQRQRRRGSSEEDGAVGIPATGKVAMASSGAGSECGSETARSVRSSRGKTPQQHQAAVMREVAEEDRIEGPLVCVAGEPTHFVLRSLDAYGNFVREGGAEALGRVIAVDVVAETRPDPVVCSVLDNGDGTYLMSFELSAVGEYQLEVRLGEEDVPNLPPVRVTPARTDARSCLIDRTQFADCHVGLPAQFDVFTFDRFKNTVYDPCDVAATVEGPETVHCEVHNNRNGSYMCMYTATRVGRYYVRVVVNGEPLTDMASFDVTAGDAYATLCTLDGDGLESCECGTRAEFTLTAMDSFGNEVKRACDHPVTASIKGTSGVAACEVRNNGDGTYGISYLVEAMGLYRIMVKLGNSFVNSQPFRVEATPGPSCSSLAKVTAPTSASAGTSAVASLVTIDRFGNERSRGGDRVAGTFTHVGPPTQLVVTTSASATDPAPPRAPRALEPVAAPAPIDAAIEDHHDGSYSLVFLPKIVGRYRFDARANGDLVGPSDGSFIDVGPGRVLPDLCYVSGAASLSGVAGEESSFVITARDAFGNFTTCPAALLRVSASMTETVMSIVDMPSLAQASALRSLATGRSATSGGSGDAMTAAVATMLRRGPSNVSLPSVSGASSGGAGAGSGAAAFSATGVRSATAGSSSGSGAGPARPATTVNAQVSARGGSDLGVTYSTNRAGTLEIELEMQTPEGYVPLPQSPVTVQIEPGATDIAMTRCAGDGLSRAVAGAESWFVVIAHDANGNPRMCGGDVVTVSSTEVPAERVSVTDREDGTYVVHYSVQRSGRTEVAVHVNGECLPGHPVPLTVHAGSTEPSACIARGASLTTGKVQSHLTYRLHCRDAYGNPRGVGGDEIVPVFKGPSNAQTSVKDCLNGDYVVAYTVRSPGTYTVQHEINGVLVDHVHNLTIVSNATDVSKCTIEGVSRSGVGETTRFTVVARDALGERRSMGGDNVKVRFTRSGMVTAAAVWDARDGTYTVTVVLDHRGIYDVEATVNGEVIHSSSPHGDSMQLEVV